MFGRLWRFIKRNKGKLFVASVLAGGTYYVAVNYLREKFKEYREMEAAIVCDKARKYHHFDCVQRSCNITVLSMLPNVELVIRKCFDVEKLLSDLEKGTNDRIPKWNELKIMSIARAVATLYVCCLLVVLLRVQFNIIAGHIYPETISFNITKTGEISSASTMLTVQRRYLELIHYFIDEGIPRLCTSVQAGVTSVMGSVSLKERFSVARLRGELGQVRNVIQTGDTATARITHLLMPQTHTPPLTKSPDDQFFDKLVKATNDTINSDCFHGLLQQFLTKGEDQLMEFVSETYSSLQPTVTEPGPAQPVEMALAKLLPVMCGVHIRMCSGEHNTFLPQLMTMAPLKDFSTRVYEAASYRGDQVT